jgi:RNase adaptor protein for sRNA GlmZ degradation
MSYTQLVKLERYVEEFDAMLEVASERESAIIAACFIDDITDSLVERYETAQLLHPPQAQKREEAGYVIKKFDRLRQQGMLTEQQSIQLQLLRDIRNTFAHNLQASTFGYPEIARLLSAGPGTPRVAFRALINESARLLYRVPSSTRPPE